MNEITRQAYSVVSDVGRFNINEEIRVIRICNTENYIIEVWKKDEMNSITLNMQDMEFIMMKIKEDMKRK